MKKSDVDFQLRMMEQCRMLSYEAETKAEEKRLNRQYNQMWKSIEPYVTGKKSYSDAAPTLI